MKGLIISFLIAGVFIGGIVFLLSREKAGGGKQGSTTNVSIIDGKQVIEITAKGLYSPKNTVAKADMPTVIKMKTSGTFDCTKSLNFPSLKIRKFLPPTGETLIELPEQKSGSSIKGICSMGMYSFVVNFN